MTNRCEFFTHEGKRCKRAVAHDLGCEHYCWQHAEEYIPRVRCVDGGSRRMRGKYPAKSPVQASAKRVLVGDPADKQRIRALEQQLAEIRTRLVARNTELIELRQLYDDLAGSVIDELELP